MSDPVTKLLYFTALLERMNYSNQCHHFVAVLKWMICSTVSDLMWEDSSPFSVLPIHHLLLLQFRPTVSPLTIVLMFCLCAIPSCTISLLCHFPNHHAFSHEMSVTSVWLSLMSGQDSRAYPVMCETRLVPGDTNSQKKLKQLFYLFFEDKKQLRTDSCVLQEIVYSSLK